VTLRSHNLNAHWDRSDRDLKERKRKREREREKKEKSEIKVAEEK